MIMETGEEKEFLPIHIKEFQLKVYPNKNLLDDEVWNFIHDISIANSKTAEEQTIKVYNR